MISISLNYFLGGNLGVELLYCKEDIFLIFDELFILFSIPSEPINIPTVLCTRVPFFSPTVLPTFVYDLFDMGHSHVSGVVLSFLLNFLMFLHCCSFLFST